MKLFVFHPILMKLVEIVVHMGNYNFTSKSDEKQKSFINSPFFCSEFQSVSRIVKIVHSGQVIWRKEKFQKNIVVILLLLIGALFFVLLFPFIAHCGNISAISSLVIKLISSPKTRKTTKPLEKYNSILLVHTCASPNQLFSILKSVE